jgi:hypothetical protein
VVEHFCLARTRHHQKKEKERIKNVKRKISILNNTDPEAK